MPTLLPTPKPSLIFKELATGAVLFSPDTEIYFGLNVVGTQVWRRLPPATETLEELVQDLAREYTDVPPQVIRDDVVELLRDLEKHGLVAARPSAVDAARGA